MDYNAWYRDLYKAGKVSKHMYSNDILDTGKGTHYERTMEIIRHGVGSPIASTICFDKKHNNWNAITTRGIFVVFYKEGIDENEITFIASMFPVQPFQEQFKRCTEKMDKVVLEKLIKICENNQKWNPQGEYRH